MRDHNELERAALKNLLNDPQTSREVPLLRGRNGQPLLVVANALMMLRTAPEFQDVFAFDESKSVITVRKPSPWSESRIVPFPWADEDDIRCAEWLQCHGLTVNPQIAGQAVRVIAREHGFHPIREYLDSLAWDGVPRLNSWLHVYLGVEQSHYASAVGSRWMIQAVARVRKAGSKADTVLILEGEQGTFKSTALRTLADPWFTDAMPDVSTKDAMLQIQGVWIIELSELDSLHRSDISQIKAFISRATDRFRPPYGKHSINVPRQCCFAGTTNQTDYFRDETGNRRFWPVRCGMIDIAALKCDRDQLWAEAQVRVQNGEVWWLDDRALIVAATKEQQDRYEGDPWDEPIRSFLEGRDSIGIEEILGQCLEKPKGSWTQLDKNRIARCLKSLGWKRHQKREGESRKYRYLPPPMSPEVPPDSWTTDDGQTVDY